MAPTWSKLLQLTSSKVTPKNILLAASIIATTVATTRAITWDSRGKGKKYGGVDYKIQLEEKKKDKAAVDGVFFRRVYKILKILVPNFFSAETGFMALIAAVLVARTYCDVWMISMTTKIERTIISRSLPDFKENIGKFMTAMPLISFVNCVLKYGLNELKLRFRTRLTMNLHDQYLSGFTYYQMSNLDNRISNPDQLLTQDIDRFCDCIVELYSNITKPLLDIILYVKTLTGTVGAKTPSVMIGYLALSGVLLTRLRRPVGKMTMTEQRLEGEFRYVNSRIITNSEEIAFYQGNKREKVTVKKTFMKLVDHLRDVLNFRFAVGVIDNIIAKYLATVVGFTSVGMSFLDLRNKRFENMESFQIMEDYYWTGRMVIRMAEAIGRLVLAGREMTKLSGFTARVTELMVVLKDLEKDKYVRTLVKKEEKDKDGETGKIFDEPVDMTKRGAVVEKDHIIKFEDVPLVTPNGDVLLKKMNFEVTAGRNVLVCGPNGCGKSSLFRVLGELWPFFGGKLTKPHAGKLFYVPQRPYMTLGTLRDQVIYPDNIGDMLRKGISERDLENFLDKVHLGYILEREGGWDVTQDWIDVLSGGEKQRIAMARLFYHKPQFAILDECTSAVSVDVEGYMYTHCKEVGITLFTVSHRRSLWKYHEYVLYMDGRGACEFKPIEESTTEFGS